MTEREFISVLEYIREQLRNHMFPVTHRNGYPVEAVPKATTESLPQMIKFKDWVRYEKDKTIQ